jgi:6-phosphogluconate dehydrogenase
VQLGMIGLGRMGSNMVRRLSKAGHQCVVYDRDSGVARALADAGATAAPSALELVQRLSSPRVVWIMIPAAAVDPLLNSLAPALAAGDIVIDGGNSYYGDDRRRSAQLAQRGVRYLDVGTSGGLWGLERGYCLMVGGEGAAVAHVDPILAALAPGASETGQSSGVKGTAARGYLHCGPSGAGHFVKMIHNGIEYGLMAAFAEGFNLLHRSGGDGSPTHVDAETAPTLGLIPADFKFKLDQIAEVWRHGSVISSWLLDLIAIALAEAPGLDGYEGHVADSGEGRWTVEAAIDAGVPVPVLATALFGRFTSRGQADFADRMLSAMRFEFGGHREIGGGAAAKTAAARR